MSPWWGRMRKWPSCLQMFLARRYLERNQEARNCLETPETDPWQDWLQVVEKKRFNLENRRAFCFLCLKVATCIVNEDATYMPDREAHWVEVERTRSLPWLRPWSERTRVFAVNTLCLTRWCFFNFWYFLVFIEMVVWSLFSRSCEEDGSKSGRLFSCLLMVFTRRRLQTD